jgi:hypothetical protein
MNKGNVLSEKETLMEEILLYRLEFALTWAYYVGTCCCFSPVSEEKMKRFVKGTGKRIVSEMKRAGVIPLEGPLNPLRKDYKCLGIPTRKMFPGTLPARKDLEKFHPECRKKKLPNQKGSRFILEAIRWGMH